MNPRGFTPRLKTMLTPKAGVQTEKIDGAHKRMRGASRNPEFNKIPGVVLIPEAGAEWKTASAANG